MTNASPISDSQRARGWKRYSAWILLALIAGLALFIRLNGISRESVWWDEFSSVVHLDPPEEFRAMPGFERWEAKVGHRYSPNFMTFWSHLPETTPPQRFPIYYFLQYSWNRYVCASPDSLRIVSLSLAMLTLLLVYLIGRDLFGATAGLIALLCFALSPIHRYFAQEIREYAAVAPLGLLSAYTFIHVVRTGKRKWWILHVVANLLFLSTHLFAICALPVEAAFLVLTRRPSVRGVVLWALIHFLLVIPWALFVMSIEFIPVQETASYMGVPPLRDFIGDVFADDCIGLTWQRRPEIDSWKKWLSAERAAGILRACRTVGWSAVGVLLFGVAWLFVRTSLGSRRGCREDSETRWWLLFLLMWLIIPPVMLYVTSIVLRPCISPRYTIYASLALYPIVGVIIARVRGIWARALFTGCLLLFYGYQQSLTFEGPARTDYKGAARHIRASLKPADCILVRAALWERVFAYTLGPVENIMSSAETDSDLAEMTDFLLRAGFKPQPVAGEPRVVWVVLLGGYVGDACSSKFDSLLRDRHLEFACAEFRGAQHVAVYEVRLDPNQVLARPPKLPVAAPEDAAALSDLIQRGDFQSALVRWRNTVDGVLLTANAHFEAGQRLLAEGRVDEAISEFLSALETYPHFAAAHERLGFVYLIRKDTENAIAELEKAAISDPALVQARMELAQAYAASNNLQAAILHWRKVVDLDPANADAYYNLVLSFCISRQYDSAWETVNKWRQNGGIVDQKLLDRLKQDSGRSQ